MRCPNCGKNEDKVLESRTMGEGETIRRRRECLNCGYRFTSYETIEEKTFMVIKRDGRREPFDRSKLEKGIHRAIEKRPIDGQTVENLVTQIFDEAVHQAGISREVSTTELGERVLEKLSHLDTVAYIRFASVYRHFENLDEFVKVAKEIKKQERNKT